MHECLVQITAIILCLERHDYDSAWQHGQQLHANACAELRYVDVIYPSAIFSYRGYDGPAHRSSRLEEL